MAAKRVFLFLPVLAIVLGYWCTILSVLTVPFRSDRQQFVSALFVTWWDLGRATFTFWGGFFKFVFTLAVATFALARLLVVGTWVLVQDLLLIPFRVIANLGHNVLSPGIPWIAVTLTLTWCGLEAVIFTFVTTPLVMDTLSNLTGTELTAGMIRVPLFLFMSFIVLGSYSVLSTWTTALKSRDVPAIVKIGVIEGVALFVEIVFLYREFVDALVPWFAQHTSGNFELGIFGTLFIAGITWFGIRGLSWFLFASAGTPTIMAVIQGNGLKAPHTPHESVVKGSFQLAINLLGQIRSEVAWVQDKGELLVGAFILPPLQVVAAATNFCMVLVTKQHLFRLPFREISDLKDAKTLLGKMGDEAPKRKAA